MDHVLRLASAIYALMNSPSDSNTPAELLMKTKLFLQTMEISSLSHFLPNQVIYIVNYIAESEIFLMWDDFLFLSFAS